MTTLQHGGVWCDTQRGRREFGRHSVDRTGRETANGVDDEAKMTTPTDSKKKKKKKKAEVLDSSWTERNDTDKCDEQEQSSMRIEREYDLFE